MTKITKEKGIFSIIDITQSVGILPIDVQKWDTDFIIGSSLK
ncbi:aminotransferase class V-fold PLP-dependent enzyme [Legionella sp.]